MGMLDKPLQQVTADDITHLVTSKVEERRTLDYKLALSLKTDDDKKEIARDVVSFANTEGGDLIYGVGEATDAASGEKLGYPGAAPGLDSLNFDEAKKRIESILHDTVFPRLPAVDFHKVEGFEKGPVMILRVARSWIGPHMVGAANRSPFLSRHSAGRYPMDVHEIRSAFLAQTDAGDRIRRFRDSRLVTIASGGAPVALVNPDGRGKVVIHGLPVGRVATFDLHAIARTNILRPFAGGWNPRFNADGYVASGDGGGVEVDDYVQAFRDGSFEDVSVPAVHGNEREIYAGRIEARVVNRAELFATLLRGAGYRGPIVVLVTLAGVLGAKLYRGNTHFGSMRPLHVMDLELPDVALDDSSPISSQLRPALDVLWQAGGVERSPSFDASGVWKDPTQR